MFDIVLFCISIHRLNYAIVLFFITKSLLLDNYVIKGNLYYMITVCYSWLWNYNTSQFEWFISKVTKNHNLFF